MQLSKEKQPAVINNGGKLPFFFVPSKVQPPPPPPNTTNNHDPMVVTFYPKRQVICIDSINCQNALGCSLGYHSQDQVARKLINANPRLKVNRGFHLAHYGGF